jgi:CheY-like chemotaxis protein/HPt (histidine-containing phosphotransfer) domain-containing protein
VKDAQQLNPHPSPQLSLHVLLIEERPINQTLAVRMLERHGCTVIVANGGKEALAATAQQPFDLIMTQVQLLATDGLDLIALVRQKQMETGWYAPILAMTTDEDYRQKCLEAGVSGCVSRPAHAPELITAIQHLFPTQDLAGVIDWQQALSTVGGDKELLRELVEAFLAEHGAWLTELREAIVLGDAPRLRNRAHALKGNLATVPSRGAVESARILEDIGRKGRGCGTGTLAGAEPAYATLAQEIGRVRRAMTHFLAGRSDQDGSGAELSPSRDEPGFPGDRPHD